MDSDHAAFSLAPTFAQGLLLGQLSVVLVLALVLKHLFLLAPTDGPSRPPPRPASAPRPRPSLAAAADAESADWVNALAGQIADVYRARLRGGLEGPAGDEVARARTEAYANEMRPRAFLDHITVHAVHLGDSAPLLSNAEIVHAAGTSSAPPSVRFHMSYADSMSVSLSTAYLFNYPMPSFARLPLSLTISLDLFESTVAVVPPSPLSAEPALTVSLPPDFTLDLKTTSLMGSRAMLKDVPKLHELIENQVRRTLASRGSWRVALPGLGNVVETDEDGGAES